jgi:hypothetical protein
VIGALEGLAHVLGHRSGHEQHVGMARRGDEADAETLEVVERVAQRMDLELAAVAGAGVDLADRERAAEPPAGGAVHFGGDLGQDVVAGPGCTLGQSWPEQAEQQGAAHG